MNFKLSGIGMFNPPFVGASIGKKLRRLPVRLVGAEVAGGARDTEAGMEEPKVLAETNVLVDAMEGMPLSKSVDSCRRTRDGV